MFKFFEPNKVFTVTSKSIKYVLFLFIIVISIGLIEALILSPEDYKQNKELVCMYQLLDIRYLHWHYYLLEVLYLKIKIFL